MYSNGLARLNGRRRKSFTALTCSTSRALQVEVVTDAAGEEEIELDDSPGAAWRLDVSGLPLVVTASQVGEPKGARVGTCVVLFSHLSNLA